MCIIGCDRRPTCRDAASGTTAPCAANTALVRLVDDGGSPATASASVKTILEVSNRVTTQDLPTDFAAPSPDRDNFKVEVFDDSETGSTISKKKTEIEMLKSVLTPVPGGGGFTFAPAPFSPPRKLNVELHRVGTTNTFRSKYLRLVVDDVDQAANREQTVLADWDPNAPTVEILKQIVRVKYQGPNGPISADATVGGPNRSVIRVACHILRRSVGGAPIVTVADATTRLRKWFRRVYAQISMAPDITTVREVDPVENLISISNETGANASGTDVAGTGTASQISFTIRSTRAGVPDVVQAVGPHGPAANDTPLVTAQALRSLIQAQPNFSVNIVPNPSTLEAAVTQGSVDLIITDPLGGRVVIEALQQNDGAQSVTVGRVDPANFIGWSQTVRDDFVGSIQQRTLIHAHQQHNPANDRIDFFFMIPLPPRNDRGQAMRAGSQNAAGKQALAVVAPSAFLARRVMDGTDANPFSLPHECGHVLMDVVHANDATQLMTGSGTSPTNVVGGSKRYSESPVPFDFPAQNFDQEARIRSVGAPLLGPLI